MIADSLVNEALDCQDIVDGWDCVRPCYVFAVFFLLWTVYTDVLFSVLEGSWLDFKHSLRDSEFGS